MNQFTAKKIGEVLAFSRVDIQTFEKGQNALVQVFGPREVARHIKDCLSCEVKLETVAPNNKFNEIIIKQAASAGRKLQKLRDVYLESEWNNSIKLLEWLGLFQGAAIVRWSIVHGAAQKLKLDSLLMMAESAMDMHETMLDQVSLAIRKQAIKKTK